MTNFSLEESAPQGYRVGVPYDFVVEQSAWGRSALLHAALKQKRTITMAPSIVLFVAARKDSQEKQKSTLKACDPVVTLRQLAASILGPDVEVGTVVAAAKLGRETTTFTADDLGYIAQSLQDCGLRVHTDRGRRAAIRGCARCWCLVCTHRSRATREEPVSQLLLAGAVC